jgi:predicted signal transduction protein with EAL and GGDEF domain
LRLKGHSLSVGASIGIAIGPESGESAEDLLHRADMAMYVVKRARPRPSTWTGPAVASELE